ncbi:MAG: ABC transporter permease, partial [Acidimicrobiia bacterium]
MFQKFLNLVISGAVTGAIYSLVASGLVLSYTATGIFNLGYGAMAFASAFVYYELKVGLGWPILPAATVTILVFAPLLGLTLDRLIFRSLVGATESARIMATVGILVAVPALVRWVVEVLITTFDADIPDGRNVFVTPGIGPSPKVNWTLPGRIALDSNQLIVFITAVVCAFGLWLLLRHTALGLQLRAAVDRPSLAELRGVNRDRASATSWVLGSILAGLAGVVAAPIFNELDPGTYTLIIFVATAAAVLGGLRSIPLAFAGGLALGVAQNLVAGYADFASNIPGFGASVPFVLLLVGLVVMGHDRARRAGVSAEVPSGASTRAEGRPWRRVLPWLVLAAFLVAYLFGPADAFWIGTTTQGLAFAMVFLSFVVVTGLGGMVNLAPAAFVTASGLTTGMLLNRYDAPYLLAVAGGITVAITLGALVALPALRVGGLSLALATLALAFLGDRVLFSWEWLRNGQAGWSIPRPAIGPVDLADDRSLAMVIIALLAVVVVVYYAIEDSASGRAMRAVRSSEIAAETSGVVPAWVKLRIFCLSAAIAGLGGALLGTYDLRVTTGAYPATLGMVWLAAVVLWGVRHPGAAIAAGLTTAMIPALLRTGIDWPGFVPTWLDWDGTTSTQILSILFGLGAIQMARTPDGILAVLGGGRRSARSMRHATAAPARGDAPAAPPPAPVSVSAPSLALADL